MLRWIVLAAVVVVLAGVAAVVSEYAPNADSQPSFAVDTAPGPKPKVEVPGPLIVRLWFDGSALGRHT